MKLSWACLSRVGMFLLLIPGIFFAYLPAEAAEPGTDYWFTESFTLGDVELPAGVTIHTSIPAEQARGSIILENQSDTLLFVLSLNYKDVLVMVTPDPNWKIRVLGAHEVASYLVAPSRPATLTMEALTDLDSHLEDRNVLSIEPPPVGISIPASQDSELLLVYGEQVMEVPFTISYELNTNFENGIRVNTETQTTIQVTTNPIPITTQQASDHASLVGKQIIVIGLAGLAFLLIVGWLLWKGMSRPR